MLLRSLVIVIILASLPYESLSEDRSKSLLKSPSTTTGAVYYNCVYRVRGDRKFLKI